MRNQDRKIYLGKLEQENSPETKNLIPSSLHSMSRSSKIVILVLYLKFWDAVRVYRTLSISKPCTTPRQRYQEYRILLSNSPHLLTSLRKNLPPLNQNCSLKERFHIDKEKNYLLTHNIIFKIITYYTRNEPSSFVYWDPVRNDSKN